MSKTIERIKFLRSKEKEIVTEILDLLHKINSERLYVTCNTNSLFKFCTHILGYTDTEANMRINAMRMIQKLPEIKNDLITGDLSLTQVSMLEAFSKKQDLDPAMLAAKIKNKSVEQTKYIFDKIKDPEIKPDLKLTLPEHIAKKLKKFATDENLDLVEAIEYLLDQKIEKKVMETPKESKSINQRYISKKVREFVLTKARHQCEARYNNQRCTSKTNLQLDHVRPVSLGGMSETTNLRVLCFHCNQRSHIQNKAAKFLPENITKMRTYLG